MTTNRRAKPYPAEVRERAVRLVREHEAEGGGDPLGGDDDRLQRRDAPAVGAPGRA